MASDTTRLLGTPRQATFGKERERPDHNTENFVPFSLRIVYGFFQVPPLFANQGCETGPLAYSSPLISEEPCADEIFARAALSPQLCKVPVRWSGQVSTIESGALF